MPLQRLKRPLSIHLYTLEGRLIGQYHSQKVSEEGLWIHGELESLDEMLRRMDIPTCSIEVRSSIKRGVRPIRAIVLIKIKKRQSHAEIPEAFLKLIKMRSDERSRYHEFLYGQWNF